MLRSSQFIVVLLNFLGCVLTEVKSTDEVFAVGMTLDKTTITSDGKDEAVINITVVDKNGREVPDANNLISFSLSGDSKIIGVGNGDPSSHEADKFNDGANWQRKLFNGKCQVIIQAGKTAEIIKLSVSSPGLQTSVAGISSNSVE